VHTGTREPKPCVGLVGIQVVQARCLESAITSGAYRLQRACQIQMDIGWTAETFPEQIAVHIAKARSASRGAAIDAHE